MKRTKRFAALFLCVLAVFLLLPTAAYAAEPMDTSREVSFTIAYKNGETAFQDVVFDLYQVASVDENGKFTLTEAFSGCAVDLNAVQDSKWQSLSDELESYIEKNSIRPLDSGETDTAGNRMFPNQQTALQPGLYLVQGQLHTHGGTVYTPQSFLVTLPVWDEEIGEWNYVVTASPKSSTPSPKPTATPTPRPTNPTLPQTGQLWWPVPLLAFAGLVLILLGLLRRKS